MDGTMKQERKFHNILSIQGDKTAGELVLLIGEESSSLRNKSTPLFVVLLLLKGFILNYNVNIPKLKTSALMGKVWQKAKETVMQLKLKPELYCQGCLVKYKIKTAKYFNIIKYS